MFWILFCVTHLILGSFQLGTFPKRKYPMWEHNKNPLTTKSLKIRINNMTNEDIDYLHVLEDKVN